MRSIIIAVLGLALSACGGDHSAPATADSGPVLKVDVITVRRGTVDDFHEASGEIRGRQTAALSARVMGHVESVNVRAGDAVHQGQTLIELRAPELEAGRRQAEAGLAQARAGQPMAAAGLAAATADAEIAASTHRRFQLMKDRNAATKQELDEVEARFGATQAAVAAARVALGASKSAIAQAEAALASAEAMLGYSLVLAPFDGRVIERSVDPGALAAPGRELLVIEQSGGARAEAWVEESIARRVTVGDPVTVAIDGVNGWTPAKIAKINPQVDPRTRSVLIKVDLDTLPKGHGLKPGTFARTRFAIGQSDRVLIPKSAVTVRGQLERVLVVDGGYALMRIVTVGAGQDDSVEILSGLRVGEKIVGDWTEPLADGAKVESR